MGISLPDPPKPSGTYLPSIKICNVLLVSGMIPKMNKQIYLKGKIGRELDKKEGYKAARLCALNALSVVKDELGSLNKIKRVLKIVGYVASETGFTDQSMVVNGASDILVDIFGENGKHARVSVGVAELPGNVPVEIEFMFEIINS